MQSETVTPEVSAAIVAMLALTEEAISYAPEYFDNKWQLTERFDALRPIIDEWLGDRGVSELKATYDARPIAVGDTVTWTQQWPHAHTRSGVVNFVTHTGRYVTVTTQDGIGEALVEVAELTSITPPVQGAIERVVDDYTFAVAQAGSLGGVELL